MIFDQCAPSNENDCPKKYERMETKDVFYNDDELEELFRCLHIFFSENLIDEFQRSMLHLIEVQEAYYIPFLPCFKDYIYPVFLEILRDEVTDTNTYMLTLNAIINFVSQEDCEYRILLSNSDFIELFICQGLNGTDEARIVCIGILSYISNNNESVSTEILFKGGMNLVSSLILTEDNNPELIRKSLNIFCNFSKYVPDELFSDALRIIAHLISNNRESIWGIIFGTNLITNKERAQEILHLPRLGNAINIGLESLNDGEVALFICTLYYYIDEQIPGFNEELLIGNLSEDLDGTTYQALGNMLTSTEATKRFFLYPIFFDQLISPFESATYIIQSRIIECIYNLFQTGDSTLLSSCFSENLVDLLVSGLELDDSKILLKVLSIIASILQIPGTDQFFIQKLDEGSFDLVADSDDLDLVELYDNLCELYPSVFNL